MTPSGVRRVVPEITICTTLVAVRSFTPACPNRRERRQWADARPVMTTHAGALNTRLPSAFAVAFPAFGGSGAGGEGWPAESGDAIGGTLRRYVLAHEIACGQVRQTLVDGLTNRPAAVPRRVA